jgi:hypothetical protein
MVPFYRKKIKKITITNKTNQIGKENSVRELGMHSHEKKRLRKDQPQPSKHRAARTLYSHSCSCLPLISARRAS